MWACDARRDPELLARCYAASPQGYWTNLRNDERMHARIAALLERFAGGRQLCDVGCGDGRLLMALRTRWRVHGLEAAPAAVKLCRAKDLDVEFGTPANSDRVGAYDAVTCVDTLEHMLDPVAELSGMAAMLRAGGVLLAITGDARSWTARLSGAAWEYLHCVGHISVLSRAGLCRMLTGAGLSVLTQRGLGHSASVGIRAWAAVWLGNLWRRFRGYRSRRVPYCHDHQLVIARKPAG
ncbi:MAG TPA: class I SAM-dependent methyltransferase [Phycisphaerae bacterium]|nr:class I SAM-dependent methyltransferase [Phycisphaerae bacterium]